VVRTRHFCSCSLISGLCFSCASELRRVCLGCRAAGRQGYAIQACRNGLGLRGCNVAFIFVGGGMIVCVFGYVVFVATPSVFSAKC